MSITLEVTEGRRVLGGPAPPGRSDRPPRRSASPAPADPPPPRSRTIRRLIAIGAVVGVVVTLARLTVTISDWPAGEPPVPSVSVPPADHGGPGLQRARGLLGTPPSNGGWFSGIWAGGGTAGTSRVASFGAWRGTPADAATMYPEATSWQAIHDSDWHVTTYDGFRGVLVYGLPMLPDSGEGNLRSIVAGQHDWVYRQVARDLTAAGRGRSIVRIGWEANGNWFRWTASAQTAAQYVAAFRHIVAVLRTVAPDLVIDFDVACGTALRGQTDRLDALTKLYPGDDSVDLVGCDSYDWYRTTATDETSWAAAVQPKNEVGIQDVANFARAHKKGLTIPEWGLASPNEGGGGDNPFFVTKMRSFFATNSDILVVESYFSEPNTSIANSIWDPDQNPKSSEVYVRLW